MAVERTPVLIVGGGPFGLTLALELGRRGVDAMLIDAKPGTAVNPKAMATQARTMEHYRRLGFADEIRALGLPPDHATDIAYFTRYSAFELARFRLPSARQAQTLARILNGSWSAAELPHRVSQKFVEQVLRRHASGQRSISINYGWRLRDFDEAADGVHAQLEEVATGRVRHIIATFLIGADGARSLVRQRLGISYRGDTGVRRDFFGGQMVAVYLRSAEFARRMAHDPAWMYWAFNPERRSWVASVDGCGEFAFHTQLKPDVEGRAVTHERARELFWQAAGAPIPIEVLSVGTWIAGHALVAERFGGGHIYIGGDAAHLFTPAGGLGYNTAVEDAINLAWKLAATLQRRGGPELLPSYEFERRKVAIRNTAYARQLAESIGNFVPQALLEAQGPQGECARAEAGACLNAHARREFNIPGITFGGRYDGSPVISSDGTEPPEDSANEYVPTAAPGGRPPHLWLEDGRSLFDLFGRDWTLLNTRPESASTAAFESAARDLDLTIVRLDDAHARELYQADLVLIRPDQIVAWRGDDCRAPAALFRRLMGYGDSTAE
jgi:2-polyprenyl-6-methoxyphenol hydroxylase-like FAD-dependent oxidoreductase